MSEWGEVASHLGIAQTMAATLSKYGLDPDPLFTEAGLPTLAEFKPQDRLDALKMQQVWRKGEALTGDPAFGLMFADTLKAGAFQGLGFACVTSDTLLDALERVAKYYRLISSQGEVIVETTDMTMLWYKIPAPKGAGAPASLDGALGTILKICRLASGDEFAGRRVELQRPHPGNTSAFEAFFKCSVDFDAEENRIWFDSAVLKQPLPMANQELARANDQVVIDYLARCSEPQLVSKIRGIVIEALPTGVPNQAEIAGHVHQSLRTFQRRLKDEGYTFRQLVEEIRQDLAVSYLKEAGKSIGEVTYLLGYTEPTNFTRSFKRWTGLSPLEYRQAHV